MPDFKIRMPDGQIKTVSGPDREGAMAFAKANYSPTTTPTTAAPQPEVNPEGVSIGRALKRGAIQTYAAAPTALAMADIQKLQDADQLQRPGGVNALAYDELMKTRVPLEAMAGRSVNLDVNTLEGRRSVDALQDRYNLKPGEKVNYLLTLDKRLKNAENVTSKSQEDLDSMVRRVKTNAKYAGDLQDEAAAIPRGVQGGIYAEELANAPDTWKGWLSTVTNDPVGFVEFIGETAAESGAQIVAGLTTSLLTRSPKAGAIVMGSGGFAREYGNEVASFLEENGIDLSDQGAVRKMFKDPKLMDEANSRGVTRGVVIAAADFAGQGLVAREFFKKSLTRQVAVQMGTEGGGEALATKAVGDDFSVKDTVTEALAGGVSAAPEALVAGNSLWQRRYNKEDGKYKAAASDLARLLRSISDAEGLNLKDVTTQGAAKQTLEAAHEQISGQVKAIVGAPGVRKRLSPKNAETLDQLLEDYAAATTAVRQGKNKVKSKVTDENAQAMTRLLGAESMEAQQLSNLFAQGNVLTDLFADGTKGGISQFTDFLNPLQNDGGGGFNIYRGLNVLGGVAGATQFGIPATAGIVLGGRALDAATGRRSKVNRFVKKLEKLTGQDRPTGRSLIADAALEKQQAEQAKADDAAAKAAQEAEDANIVSTLAGMTGNATDGSPLGIIAVGTGIPTEELQTVVSELRLKHPADSKKPEDVAINKVLDDAQAGINGEQKPIRALTQLVNLVNNHLDASPMDGGSSVKRTSLPDQPLAQARAIQMGNAPNMDAAPTQPQAPTAPNVDTAAPAQPTVNGNQTTTSENYQAGIQANRDTALKLQEQVLDTLDLQNRQATNRPGGNLTPTMLEDEANSLYVALEAVQTENMPLEVMEEVQQMLLDEGVTQENVDKFYKPYVDRVRRQQKRKPSMLAQAQATQEAIQGEPVVNAETAPAPSVLEQAQDTQRTSPIADRQDTAENDRRFKAAMEKYGPSSSAPMSDDSRSAPEMPTPPSVPEMPSGPALNQVNNPLQVSDADLDATNMTIMPSPEELSEMKGGTYKPTQKRTLVEFAQVLQDRWQKATGRTTPFEQTPENIDQISRLMATEAANALNSDSNAIGWYDRKLKAAKSVVSLVDPRVTQSPENEAAFDYALAVTSNGQAVADNFEYAMSVFREFMDTGRMPTDTWIKGGERNQAMVDAFSFFNAYQDSGQNVPMRDFLDSDFTVSDLTKYIGQFNSQYGTNITVPSSEGATEMVKGSYIVGPKIGQGFYQNIRGNYDPLTMDIWWMRMWNRLNGRAFEDLKDLDKNRSTIRAELKSADVFGKQLIKETMSDMGLKKSDLKNDATLDDFVSKLDKRYQAFFRKSKKQNPKAKPPKPQLFKSTGTMVKNLVPQLQAQPKNAGERSYMRQVTKEALSKLSNIGINISTADFQALMWYPEKQLFRKGGVAPGRGSDNDYLDAAKMLATKEGITNEQIEEALPASERSGAINNIPGPEGQDGGLYTGPDESQATADNSILANILNPPRNTGGRAPRSDAELGPTTKGPTLSRVALTAVKRFVPEAKVPFQVGKRGTKYEDGIQTLDQALGLAQTLGITVRLFDSQDEAFASRYAIDKNADRDVEASFYLKGPADGGKGAEGTVFGLNPGALLDNGSRVSGIEALSNVIHEIAHGMTLGPLDLNGSQANDTAFTNPVTGQIDRAPDGSFSGSALRPLLEGAGDPDIMSEIDNLQLNVDAYTTNDPAQRSALRGVRSLMESLRDWKDYYQKEVDAGLMSQADAAAGMDRRQANSDYYTDYMQGVRELAVDPVLIYLINPKLAKAVMPKTAALIREQFNNAGNNKVKFFSHPMAVVIATVMAMLAQGMAEEEEEKQQMQMPPGALSPPPQGMGALTA